MDGKIHGLDVCTAVVEILEGHVDEMLDAIDVDGRCGFPVLPRVVCIRYGRLVVEG